MSRPSILIFIHDPLGAALVAAAIELAGQVPHFTRPGESARDALRRTRPGTVFIGTSHPESYREAFIGPALMTGARIVVIRSPRDPDSELTRAHQLGLPVINLPDQLDDLLALLDATQ